VPFNFKKKAGHIIIKKPSLKDNKNKWKFQSLLYFVNLFAKLGGMALKWAHCWTPWVNQHPHWYHGNKNLKIHLNYL
jgi:hypothetical protein